MHEYKFYVWFNIFLAGDDVLNGCNRKRKLHKPQTATTVESLEVDAYVADIKRVENPFVKVDEDSKDDILVIFLNSQFQIILLV